MAEEITDFKKLSPKERIKRLKELQEKSKDEIEKAQKLIKEAEEQAGIEDELREIPIPQLKAVDIDALFTPEERELFKEKRFVTGKPKTTEEKPAEKKDELERIAEEAPRPTPEQEEEQVEYVQQLSQKPIEELYGKAKELYTRFKQQGEYLTREQLEEFKNIEYANKKKLEDIEAGRYTEASQETAREMVLIEKMKNIIGGYQR